MNFNSSHSNGKPPIMKDFSILRECFDEDAYRKRRAEEFDKLRKAKQEGHAIQTWNRDTSAWDDMTDDEFYLDGTYRLKP